MAFDHLEDGIGSGLFLYHGVDHRAVFIDCHDRQAQNLLGDGQSARLGGVEEFLGSHLT